MLKSMASTKFTTQGAWLAPLICGGTKGTDIQMIVEEDVEKAMSWNSIDSSSTNPSLIILCVPAQGAG